VTTVAPAARLEIGHAAAMQGSTLSPASGATVAFTAAGSSYTIGGLAGSATLDATGNALTVGGNNASTTFSGSLTADSLTKAGSGTLTVSGTNTLFLSFTTVMSTRFKALVLEPDGGYAASQLSFSLRHASGASIPLDRTLLPDPSASVEIGLAPVSSGNSPYADFGYWDQGYTDNDDQPIADLIPLEFFEPAEARLYAAYTAVDLPSGGYVLAISSRAWTETPLILDLTLRASALLAGEASSTTLASLRLSLVRLFGEATGSDLTTGYIPKTAGIIGEATGFGLSTAVVTVTSPFVVTKPGLRLGQL
jgi:hypothetical protein